VTFGCYGTLVDGRGAGTVRVFDDVEWMLAELRAKGYSLGVLTNSADREFEAAHRAFRRPFDMFVTAERVRARKPSHRPFQAFAQLTGADRGGWVHVGRSVYHDVAPAEAHGVQGVWLDRDLTWGPPPPRRGAPDDARAWSAHVYTVASAVDAIDALFARAGDVVSV
jgi:FMN phosphatase YigB (HAD superfamily)